MYQLLHNSINFIFALLKEVSYNSVCYAATKSDNFENKDANPRYWTYSKKVRCALHVSLLCSAESMSEYTIQYIIVWSCFHITCTYRARLIYII